jgi:hypothetical protein
MELVGTAYKMGDVMELIAVEIEANKEKATTVVPTIIGDPGIGKSESLKALARSMNMDHFIVSLGALPMEWFSGLPEFAEMEIDETHHVDGRKTAKVTEWTMSDLVRSINVKTEKALKNGKEGLLVLLDDMHLVEPIIQKYLFEFLQNKTLQNYRVHEKAFLVGAMNGKDSAGLEGFLSAVIDRMALYNVEFDKEYWYTNIGVHLHPFVASFAQHGSNDKYFVGANSTDSASPSPRSWTELSNIIKILEKKTSGADFIKKLGMITESRVGHDAKLEFMKHVKLFQKFNFAEILKKKDKNFTVSSDISDQILTAFIIRYIRDKNEAEYLHEVVSKNLDKRTFISIFINEFITLYENLDQIQDENQKDAYRHLSSLVTSADEENQELFSIVVESFADLQ